MISRIKNLAVVLGTRPNFVKVAPFVREVKKHSEYNLTLIHTGQHFDKMMSKIFFEQMEIPRPDIMLNIKGDLHTEKIGKMFSSLNKVFSKASFDGVVVFGDVNSTLAGAVAAAKNTKLIHIESGLRSHDRRMPEEINRVIVDHLSDLLFTTEVSAMENLVKEGVDDKKIKYVGNLMIESLEIFSDLIKGSNILNKLDLKSREYIVVTIHRVENTDNPVILEKLLELLNTIAKENNNLVFPMHPGTRQKIVSCGLKNLLVNLNIVEPLGYLDFMKLVENSQGVITDSGGIQEETSHLGIPCATLRDNTERPITLELGSNKLFPIETLDKEEIIKHLAKQNFQKKHIPQWGKGVSSRIFIELDNFFSDI